MSNVINDLIVTVNGWVWALPLILFIFASSIYFSIRMRFVQLRSFKDQIHQVFRTTGSDAGISTFASFCTTMAARIGTGNIAGVALAIWSGGPGAVVWMLITAILTSATSYAECSLGQVYKIEQDGEFRGGPYFYIEKGLGWKKVAAVFALFTLICVPLFTTGPHANSISTAFYNSMGIPMWVTGLAVALLLAAIILGGIKRISNAATLMVPFMTIAYLIATIVILVKNAASIPSTLGIMISSAFGWNALFGGLLGAAVQWGVKRGTASSGTGMGESVPAAAAAACDHPAQQGLANAFGVYIDVIVCICTGLIVMMTDCFNVNGGGESFLYIGSGSSKMEELAMNNSAGVDWTQEAINTVLPGFGPIFVAICLFFFAFTCIINYYYQGETAIAYLLRNKTEKARKTAMLALKIIMPCVYFYFAINPASTAFAAGELGVGILVWFNVTILLLLSNTVVAVYKDYQRQYKAGEKPYFNPVKAGIKNADTWMKINKERIENKQ